jgi:hypothetical protein
MVEGEAPAVTGSDRGVGASAATSLRSWGDTAVSIRLQGGQVGDRTAALGRLEAAVVGRLAAASIQAPA